MICERCGTALQIGDFPFCHGDPTRHAPQAASVTGDEIPGGFVQEHFGHEPMTFYSKSEMFKEAKRRGLEPFVRWAGPGDRHLTRWDGVDPQTLANAAALCDPARRAGQGDRPRAVCETKQVGWR